MSYEKMLVAGCLQEAEILRKALRARLQPEHIEDKIGQYLFRRVIEIGKSGPVNSEILLESIRQDSSLDVKAKSVYIQTAGDYLRQDISNAEFTLERISARVKEREIVNLLSDALDAASASVPPEEQINRLTTRLANLSALDSNYDLFDYFSSWDERKVERMQQEDGTVKSLKMVDNMRPFKSYFERGIQAGTVTAIAGRTGAGKSILLSGMIHTAARPENKLNVLYIVAENTKIQAGVRLDSIMLDRQYSHMFVEVSQDKRGDAFFSKEMLKDWGGVMMSKVEANKFTVEDIRAMLEECRDRKFVPDVLIVDSPDHMRPTSATGRTQSWEAKGEVYWELKHLAESEELILITSLPLKASSRKGELVTAEDTAGSYDIARICDNLIAFHDLPEDKLLQRATLFVTKNRDGGIDNQPVQFRFNPSLRFTPWEDMEADVEDGLAYKIRRPDEVKPAGSKFIAHKV